MEALIEVKSGRRQGRLRGRLLVTDTIYRGGKHKMLLFQMEVGKTYQIDMTSKAFDSYLYPSNRPQESTHRGRRWRRFSQARIVHKATETGLYRIACTYFSPAAGEFKVTIRKID